MEEQAAPNQQVQLELSLPLRKVTQREKVQNWFMRLRRREEELQLQPQWRSPALAFAIGSSVAAGPLAFLIGLLLFGRMGSRVPLFYNQLSTGSKWIQVDKTVLLLLPLVLSGVLYVVLQLLSNVYKIDRRLANLLCLLLSLFNACFVLAYAQIFSLTAF